MKVLYQDTRTNEIKLLPETLDDLWHLHNLVDDGDLVFATTFRRKDEKPQGEHLLRERREGSFSRTFTLDDTVDPGSIEAAMSAGVLTVTLRRKEAVKPRRIAVKAG